MATRQQKLKFTIKRFKRFWNQFRKSKRGLLGLVMIAFFSCVAIFAPFIAPYIPIDPIIPAGKYYPGVSDIGVKIAQKYSKPAWYKYLPWITRGETELTESFYSYIVEQFGATLQFFIPEEKYSPLLTPEEKANVSTNVRLYLSHRVALIKKVEATFPNGTTVELSSPKDWRIPAGRPREIEIILEYPEDTKFEVTYMTGVDLVETMKIVNDHTFTSEKSFEEWSWASTNPSLISVGYDDQKGFKYRPDETDLGCIRISYDKGVSNLSQSVEVTVSKQFNYPYKEPPQSFFVHASIMIEGTSTPIEMEILFFREGETSPFPARKHTVTVRARYSHLYVTSEEPQMAQTLGVSPSQDKIFAVSGNYSFAVKLIIPTTVEKATIYLDNLDCMIYGNIFGIMGTDNGQPFTRDIFSLLVYGSRVSLFVGILTALFSTFIGLFLGLVSGYIGGIVDEGIMRIADLLLVLPTLPLFIVLLTALRATSGYVSMWNIILILTLFGWMSFARSVRSMVLSIRERAFIEAAKAAGGGKLHIINRHIIPNVFALVYITLATAVPGAIIVEASLSWLGLGDPRLASWGKILYDFNASGVVTSRGLLEYWFWVFPACIAIALLATAFILVGYALDEILNPRLRERR